MKKYAIILTVVSAFLLLGIVVFAVSGPYVTRKHAEQLLAVVQQIRVGVSDYEAALQATAPYLSYRSESIDGSERAIQFRFSNERLSRLKLAPYTDFIVTLVFNNDVLVWKSAREYVPSRGCRASVLEVNRGLPFPEIVPGAENPNHSVFGGTPSSIARISVYDDDTYEEAGRSKDWAFNLSCLTRLGGCRDARMMLPRAVSTER